MALHNSNTKNNDISTQTISLNSKVFALSFLAIICTFAFGCGFFCMYDDGSESAEKSYNFEKQKLLEQLELKNSDLKKTIKSTNKNLPFIGNSKVYNSEIKYFSAPVKRQLKNDDVINFDNINYESAESSVSNNTNDSANKSKIEKRKVSLDEQFKQAVKETGNENFFKKNDDNLPVPAALPLTDLPANILDKIPEFVYNAHNYSTDASRRSIILNGKKLKEGSRYQNIEILEIQQNHVIMRVDSQSFSQKALDDYRK